MNEEPVDEIARRETARSATIPGDPFFQLMNLCHPYAENTESEDGELHPAARFELSSVLMICDDETVPVDQSMLTAVKRHFFSQLGHEALAATDLLITSSVALSDVVDVFSRWSVELYELIDDAANLPYDALARIGTDLRTKLRDLCRPTADEIQRYIAEYKPDDIFDDAIGWIQFDGYDHRADIDDGTVAATLRISVNEATLNELLPIAQKVCRDLQQVDQRCRESAAAQLLPLYNDTWRPENSPELTSVEFRAAMTHPSLSIESPDQYEVWYDDGNLFLGHSIRVQMDSAGQPVDVSIEG